MKTFRQYMIEAQDSYGFVDDDGKKQTRNPFHLYPDTSRDSNAPIRSTRPGETPNTMSAGSNHIMAAKLRNKRAGRHLNAGVKGIERQLRNRN